MNKFMNKTVPNFRCLTPTVMLASLALASHADILLARDVISPPQRWRGVRDEQKNVCVRGFARTAATKPQTSETKTPGKLRPLRITKT